MSCSCPCHDLEFASSKYTSMLSSCPGCQDAPQHKPPLQLSGSNIHLLVGTVHQQDVPHYGYWKFSLELLVAPDGTPPPTAMLQIAVSKELVAHAIPSIKDILAMEMKKWVGKDSGASAWAQKCLSMPTGVYPAGGFVAAPLVSPSPVWSTTSKNDYVDGGTVVSDLMRLLPGLQAVVQCPAKFRYVCTPCSMQGVVCVHGQDEKHRTDCSQTTTIQRMIVHLNDTHRWARETEIADWLETLDVDLTFPADGPPLKKELPRANSKERLVIFGPNQMACDYETKRRRRDLHRVLQVSSSLGHRQVIERLRGLREFQYAVLPGTYMDPEVLALLEYSEAVEVGEEETPTSWGSEHSSPLADIMHEVYAAQIAYQQQQVEEFAYTHSGLIQKKSGGDWVKFEKQIQAYLAPIQGVWHDEHVHVGKPSLPPKALALQKKIEQGEQNGKFAVNPTKTPRKKKEK